jgi:septal ring factor EnvC (AmiA/AmiB activator)
MCFRLSVAVCSMLPLLLIGCADEGRRAGLESEIRERQRAIQQEAQAMEALQGEVAQIETRLAQAKGQRSPLVAAWSALRSDSPFMSACIVDDLGAKAFQATFVGQTESERSAGWIALGTCLVLSMHKDYDSTKRRFKELMQGISNLNEQIEALQVTRTQRGAQLEQLRASQRASQLKEEIERLSVVLSCERSLVCRGRRLFGLN